MEPDSDETCIDALINDAETKITCIYENGYGSAPFLMQIALTLAYNGYKIVILSKEKFDMQANLNCIQGPPAPPIHPESAKNITFLHKISSHETLLEWLFSLSNKTTSLAVLVIDKLDQYFSDVHVAALLLAVLRHTVNTYDIKLILSISQDGLKYTRLVANILYPNKILRSGWNDRCVEIRDASEKLVLQYEVVNEQIKLSHVMSEEIEVFRRCC
uniref:Uncharacterized protein n=1 Tax=Cacopsylla melanoneura TaxID=428564 RepID=A0A8D8T2N2_9HEMI